MVKDLDMPLTTPVGELDRRLVARGLGDADSAALLGCFDRELLP